MVLFFAIDAPYKRLSFNNKCTKLFYFEQVSRDLARILIMVGHQLFFGVCDRRQHKRQTTKIGR
jgi:hypothetical protein